MFLFDQPYMLLLIASVIISAALTIAILRQPPNLGNRSFAALMAAVSLWAFTYLFEVCSTDPQTKIFSFQIKFVFKIIVSLSWFTFSLYYANRMRVLRSSTLFLLTFPHIITLVIVATNSMHGLMISTYEMVTMGNYHLLYPQYGPWFWVHSSICYLMLASGFILLARHLIGSPSHYRRPVVALMIGGLTPFTLSIVYTLGIGPLNNYFDLTPFAFIISGLSFMWGILRYRLLDIVPIARDIVIQNMNDGVVVVDNEQLILDLNPAAARLIGVEPRKLIGYKAHHVVPWWPELHTDVDLPNGTALPIIDLIVDDQSRQLHPFQSTLYDKDKLLGYLITFRDVTTERQLQDQLFQSQKMEAVGTLAGGVAHDFNNLLMAMQANISLMRLNAAPDSPMAEKLNRIEDQINSGATLTRQLLGYARKGKYSVAALDINLLIEDALQVVQRANKNITVQNHACRESAYIKADKGQIELVLLNLFLNAVDAMPDGGTLSVSSRLISTEKPAQRWQEMTPGQYIEVTVTDTGIGMDKPTLDRIFEPFFTTKEIGHGTGLGLASVYGMVQNHGGHIDVRSQPGKGTTFIIIFPAPLKVEKPKRAPARPTPVIKNCAKILLVEDEPLILKYCREMIQSLEYEVLAADSGKAAINIYKDQADDIDLVVLDMIMPGMDGMQLYNVLKSINPRIKVIVTSGYSDDGRIDQILAQGGSNALRKPYTRDELGIAIADTLNAPDKSICRSRIEAV